MKKITKNRVKLIKNGTEINNFSIIGQFDRKLHKDFDEEYSMESNNIKIRLSYFLIGFLLIICCIFWKWDFIKNLNLFKSIWKNTATKTIYDENYNDSIGDNRIKVYYNGEQYYIPLY
jgi:hypothetical protein